MKLTKASGVLGFMALATVVSPLTIADESKWYLGGNIGQSRSDIDNAQIASSVLGAGITVTSLDEDDSNTGFKIFTGYQFNDHFALEAGFFDLSEFDFTATTLPVGTLDSTTGVRGLNLDLVGFLPINEKLSAFGRVGINYAEAEHTFSGTFANADATERDANPKFGLGLQYAFNERLAMRIEAERYRIDDAIGENADIDLMSVGLVYRFGAKERAVPVAAPTPEPAAPAAQPRVENYTLSTTELFEFNSAELREPQPKLGEIADAIKANEEPREIRIVGYTDHMGSENYNKKLSERRAQAVKDYLVSRGVAEDRLIVEGRGEADPVVVCTDKNRTALINCLQPNRRAQIDQITIVRKVAQ